MVKLVGTLLSHNLRDWLRGMNGERGKKSDKLLSCLKGLALEYVCELRLDKYRDIKKEISRRFNTKDNPISARRKLQYIRQHEDERLQEFAQRVHFITIDGYSESGRKAIDKSKVC